jgi:hypothetical protein
MSESKAIKRRIADGSLSMQDVNRLRDKDIAFDKLLGIAAKRGATVDKEVQRGYGVSQLKNGTVNWTPSQDMGASKYFMGGRGQDPMMAALGETPGPRAGKGWVATGEHEKGGTTYSFYGDPAYVQKRKDKERAQAAAAQTPAAAATPAAPQTPSAPVRPTPAAPTFDPGNYGTPSFNPGSSAGTQPSSGSGFDVSNFLPQMPQEGGSSAPSSEAPSGEQGYIGGFESKINRLYDRPVDWTGDVWAKEDEQPRFAASSRFREELRERTGF